MKNWRVELQNRKNDQYVLPVAFTCKLPRDYVEALEKIAHLNNEKIDITYGKALFAGASELISKYLEV